MRGGVSGCGGWGGMRGGVSGCGGWGGVNVSGGVWWQGGVSGCGGWEGDRLSSISPIVPNFVTMYNYYTMLSGVAT